MKPKRNRTNPKKITKIRKSAQKRKQSQRIRTKHGARSASVLVRPKKNPIIAPRPEHPWEAWQTFNPGVVLLENKVNFIYRAVGDDGISRFGHAISNDGFAINERLPYPVYEHKLTSTIPNYYSFASGGSFGGSEDPRIVRVNREDTLWMTYTACDGDLRVALTSIKIKDFFQKKWRWSPPKLISPPGETHKNWVLFPEKISGKYAMLHSLSPEISISFLDDLEFRNDEFIHSRYDGDFRRKNCWDNWIRGVGAPPIKTALGWLLFYHAMDESDPGKYKVGALLLDLLDPTKILYRSPKPVLEPEAHYENSGFKAGVVYVSGAVVKDSELLVYYGASDSYVSVAHAPLENFLEEFTKKIGPKLKVRPLKKK